MDLLAQYGDDDDGSEMSGDEQQPAFKSAIVVNPAPEVSTTGLSIADGSVVNAESVRYYTDPKARQVMVNVRYEDLHAPIVGPAHPYSKDGLAQGLKNHRAGYVEDAHLSNYAFEEQYNQFHRAGVAYEPRGQGVIESTSQIAEGDGSMVPFPKRRKTTAEKKAEAERKAELAAQTLDPRQPIQLMVRQPWANKEVQVAELTEEQKEYMAKIEAEKLEAAGTSTDAKGPTSFFHGKSDKDYQGRSWLAAPPDIRKESDYCYVPKRWIHTWSGHTKGVNAIRFFPKTGHLLLSAGLDGKIKMWDVNGSGKCMRTYMGHSKGVRDVWFSNDGKRFLSTGYDKVIRLWDTETGEVLRTISTGKVYYVAKFHPDDSKQNVLMAGCSDKKIYQWDLDTGDLVQEYNYHLGAVNTITFVDEGRRFVTTSDDKTIRVWEFGIPVQIKYIADPSMHSIPVVTMHPNNTYFIGQSLDNQVVTYSTKERFRQNRKKTFKGHNTAGYACQVNFSPDARFVLSGDSEGRVFIWEWQHPHKIVRTIKAHEGVCIGVAWHPLETSKVATCGWDGLIKYWD